ncbi:glycoside hydrolase family 5 protein [Ruminococcus sp.]|uniref:glycoside hydrolase family 5 protein n=1 Tax=Ruminococcus sp. TaxID=41978 RepID=UPI001B146FCB|nr:glycoside hydrolase family 5 protein [Ruminococcus sp.]MBO5558173.1 glycoside hydrolase family 5 protein [Ruminococcus sp.]
MKIKRILAAVCAGVMCVGLLGGCAGQGKTAESKAAEESSAEERSAKKHPTGEMRGLSARAYADEMGIGENLGNTFEAYWSSTSNKTTGASTIGADTPLDYEKCWGAVETTKECIDGMKAAGFSTVRIPVYWGNMMADDGKYEINADYIDRVAEVADRVLEDGMYAVINIHHFDEYIIKHKTKEEALEITGILWKQIAEYFKDYPDYLVFEGFNENLGSHQMEFDGQGKEKGDAVTLTEEETYAYVNEMNQKFVDTVRATGGNNAERVLIASGYWTNIDNTTKDSFVMPADTAEDKLMVSVHYIDNAMYWSRNVGGKKWKDYTESQCELLKAAFIDKGIPVFLGEQTSIYEDDKIVRGAEITESSELMKYEMQKALDYGFVPVLWDVNDNFYSRTECRIKSDSDAAVIKELAENDKSEISKAA